MTGVSPPLSRIRIHRFSVSSVEEGCFLRIKHGRKLNESAEIPMNITEDDQIEFALLNAPVQVMTTSLKVIHQAIQSEPPTANMPLDHLWTTSVQPLSLGEIDQIDSG
jgi:hypothetical protein